MWSDRYPPFVYWLFPELELFKTIEQAGKACRHAMGRSGFLALLMVAILGIWLIPLDKYFVVVSDLVGWISIVFIGLIPLGITWLFRRRVRRYLRKELAKCGVPICIKCGYDLRGQVEPRCPECGTPFAERLLYPDDLPATED